MFLYMHTCLHVCAFGYMYVCVCVRRDMPVHVNVYICATSMCLYLCLCAYIFCHSLKKTSFVLLALLLARGCTSLLHIFSAFSPDQQKSLNSWTKVWSPALSFPKGQVLVGWSLISIPRVPQRPASREVNAWWASGLLLRPSEARKKCRFFSV